MNSTAVEGPHGATTGATPRSDQQLLALRLLAAEAAEATGSRRPSCSGLGVAAGTVALPV
jgi:hypothetical protein